MQLETNVMKLYKQNAVSKECGEYLKVVLIIFQYNSWEYKKSI